MAKKKGDEDPRSRAERKVDKARLKLSAAEDRYTQVRERGKQEIEKARLQAAEWLAEAGAKVQKRTAALARAEARLKDATDGDAPSTDSHDSAGSDNRPEAATVEDAVLSPGT